MSNNNIFFIIITILLLIIILFLCKKYYDQNKLNTIKFLQPNSIDDGVFHKSVDLSDSLLKFDEQSFIKMNKNKNKNKIPQLKKKNKIKYNNRLYKSLYSGQKIGFITHNHKNYHTYIIDFYKNKLIEYDLLKHSNSPIEQLVEFKDKPIVNEITIKKPTSIRTCLQNNTNYITSFTKKKVYLIDVANEMMKFKGSINIGNNKGATYIDLYRNLEENINYGYTSNFNNHTVSILDLNKKIKIKDIKVGQNPIFVCVCEKNKLLCVANFSDNNIYFFNLSDPENPKKIGEFNTGINPTCIETDNGKIYVTNCNSSSLSIFTINNNKITKEKDIPVPNNEKIYSIDLNKNANCGVILTSKNIYIIDTNKDKLTKLEFTEKERQKFGIVKSVRYRYYKNIFTC